MKNNALRDSTWWFVLGFSLCLLAGAVLRFGYNEATVNATAIQADAASYVRYANNLLHHGVFSKQRAENPQPDSYWAPGYPAFLAALMIGGESLGLESYRLILAVQALLGVFTIYFTGLIAARLLPFGLALLPPALVALSPHLVAVGQNLLTETLFGFLIVAGLYFLIEGIYRQERGRLLAGGVVLALAWWVNPVSLLLAPALALAIVWYWFRKGEAPQHAPVILAGVILPVVLTAGAWSMRNQIQVSASELTSADRLLTNLIIGMHSDFHAIWRVNKRDPSNPADIDRKEIDGDYAKFAERWAAKVTADPLGMLNWYLLEKPRVLWGWEVQIGFRDIYIYPIQYSLYDVSPVAGATYSVMRTLHLPLLVLGLLGVLVALGDRSSITPMILCITLLYITFVYLATQSDPRYSFPLRGPLYILAIYFPYRAWNLLLRR
ncbi:hypothetical protein EY643_06380 [Halioglobus maricola]|uniref:Glycosyltransferase RgtA/B/C/D-like domain-containing protein n=1 Tax=Halioglobus maricola TaxID=2601894 RepID=A0A5P9NHK5_9GAMM|nr:glycosyltransferase family 39 protein [Halioglobus maricola]QFU75307.1 hypothetical protein EY643_06380 [Halioglobus maricola]